MNPVFNEKNNRKVFESLGRVLTACYLSIMIPIANKISTVVAERQL